MLTYPVVAEGDHIYTQVPGWDLIRETSRGRTLCRRAWEQVPGWGLPLCGDGFGAGNEVASTAIVAGLKAARRKLAPSLLWSRANRRPTCRWVTGRCDAAAVQGRRLSRGR